MYHKSDKFKHLKKTLIKKKSTGDPIADKCAPIIVARLYRIYNENICTKKSIKRAIISWCRRTDLNRVTIIQQTKINIFLQPYSV